MTETTTTEPTTYKHKAVREKFRFWIEVIGIPLTFVSLIFLGVQLAAQERDAATRTIIDVEDSERFINQMAFDDPEFTLLLGEAGNIAKINGIFFKCTMTLQDLQRERLRSSEFDDLLKSTNDPSGKVIENINAQCRAQRIDKQSFNVFRELTNQIVHLLPLQETLDFYSIMERSEQMTAQERYVLLRSVIEKLNSRANIVAYIFLQEFEKMYRLCQERVLDRDFWRGKNAYERMMHFQLSRPTIRNVVESGEAAIGFHPDFIAYAKRLISKENYNDLTPAELEGSCKFKRGYFLIPSIL
ncbi:hypothetical protein KHP62_17675 [Rhodobacteraceae bacterium NNCM2]|nr:hypothetical protein [Coraliihabitans acroporae]